MAGIISNVDSDVQRLRKLKNEIEEVKKALKGINIKVDVDIAKGMEAQLKSLTDQYNALVTKVAEAEGKIILSTKRINDASNKIIQAQEKISKVTGISSQPTATQSTSSNTAETASIQAQAKAYDELRDEIDSVIGTRSQNIKRMIEENNAIRLINAEIKKITKSQGEYSSLSSTQKARLEQLNNSLLTHKIALAEVRQNLSNNVKMDNAAATSMNGLSQSLSRMRMTYRELTEEERKSPFGKELLMSINQADAKIKELDATIGNHQRNVGDYAKQWNGLQYQMQMVAREMPNFAINPQIGIMSLTNNIPYLVDELKKAKDAHKAYIAEVKAGNKELKAVPSVGKQVLHSLLSWQTGLIMAITLITAYRKEISEWVTGLLKAKDAIKDTLSAEQEMALARKNAISNSLKEKTELDLLYRKLKDTTLSTKERNAAVSEWTKNYPKYANILDSELVSLGKLEFAYQSLSKQIVASAKARSYADKITELESKKDDTLTKRRNQYVSYLRAIEERDKAIDEYKKKEKEGFGTATAKLEAKDKILRSKQNVEKQKKAWLDLIAVTKTYDNAIDVISKKIKVDDLFPQPKEGSYDYWQQQAQIADAALKQIDSKQKALLDEAAKDPKKNLYDLGIDKSIVASYKQAIKLKAEAEKQLKVYDDFSKSENQADKLRREQEKYKLLLDKQKLDRIRAEEDLQMQVAQSKIDAMSDGFLKEQEQRDLNNKKEIQSIKRQKEDAIRTIIQAKKDEFDAQENLKTQQKKGYVKRIFDASTVDTSKVSSSWDVIIDNTSKKQQNDKIRQQEDAWNEYIIKYGTFTQKKEAIDRKYKQLIDESSDAGTAATFQKEWEEALTNLDLSKLKQDINWEMIFGDLSKVTKEQLRNIKKQLHEFKNSPEFQKATPEQIEVIESAFNSINNALVDKGGFFGGMVDSVTELKLATEELKNAEEELAEANKKGTEAQKEEAQKKVNAAKKKKQNAEVNVTKSSDKTIQHLTAVGDAIAQLGSSAEMSLSSFGNAAANIVDAFTEAGSKISGIVGAVFSILDGIQQQGFDKFVVNILENVAGAALSAGTFGLISKNESDKNLERDIEYLTQSNQDLKNALDNLSDKMDKASVLESNDIYQVQKYNLEKQEANTRELMQRSGAAHNDGFIGIGGSHSSNKKINDGMSASEWERVSKIVGKSVFNASQFFQLSSKEMAKLAEEDTTLYSKIKDLANDGYKDAAQYMDEYITYYKQLEELENAHNQKLTNISFDSVRDEFKNTLLDMESDAEDFTANFEKMMRNTVVEDLMTKKYDPMIQEWYNDYAKAIKDGKIDKDEREYLRKRWKEISDEGLAERDNLFDSMGLNSSSSTSQSSTSGGFQSMSQDSADELNGRFSGLQMAGEEIRNQSVKQTGLLESIDEKMSLLDLTNENLPSLTAPGVPDLAGQNKETIMDSYQPPVNIVFPEAKLDILTAEVSNLKAIVDEMRTFQANASLDRQVIAENTAVLAKNSPQLLADADEIKRNSQKW